MGLLELRCSLGPSQRATARSAHRQQHGATTVSMLAHVKAIQGIQQQSCILLTERVWLAVVMVRLKRLVNCACQLDAAVEVVAEGGEGAALFESLLIDDLEP